MTKQLETNVITVDTLLNDPTASYWLKNALAAAIERDPVDAANDARVLAVVLDNRVRGLFTE